jgi:uncharacterized membrane protein
LAVALILLAAACWFWGSRLPLGRGAAGGILLVAAVALGLNDRFPLKLYPVLVNAALLGVFGASLRFPPSAAERIARLQDPNLPAEAVPYTRTVTQVWCVFFAGNGLIALWTSVWGSDQIWFWYNGVIAYMLIGILFAGEWLVRRRWIRSARG